MVETYLLTKEQIAAQEMARDFARRELAPVVVQSDIKGEFPMDVYRKAAKLGLHAMNIHSDWGGLGYDAFTCALVREELGKVDAGFTVSLGSNCLAFAPVCIAGTEEQQKKFADVIVAGGLGGFCLTEPDAGSDAANTKTTAVRVGDEYVINGTKCFITNAGIADVFVVFASTNPELKHKGITAFLVERSREGITCDKIEDKMGIRAANVGTVSFKDVRVPVANRIGEEGQGFRLAMSTLDRTRPSCSGTAVGIMQACLDHCIEYAKNRVVFGKPISKLEGIQFMIADMEIKTQVARQMVHHNARLIDKGIYDTKIGSITKCFCSDSAVQVATDAVQIFGGYGFMKDHPVEKLYRDAKIYQIFEGTNQIQRVVISGKLLK